jgi:hypothetical protein
MSVKDRVIADQRLKGRMPVGVPAGVRVGFSLSTKDRPDFTRRTLASVDIEPGFDIVWADGSDEDEGRALPHQYRFRHARLVEAHGDVRGGPNNAIQFGLRRLLELGYDYVGLLENDLELEPGWFGRLMGLFDIAAGEGLAVGAATVRSYTSRVLAYERGYSINWSIGAGLVLFTREAAQIILDGYAGTPTTARAIRRFYGDLTGVDLRRSWELWFGRPDRRLSTDWGYDMLLYRHGFASVASIPNLTLDLEYDTVEERWAPYVTAEVDGQGSPWPAFRALNRSLMTFQEPFYRAGWSVLRRNPRWIRHVWGLYRRATRTPMPPLAKE